MLVDGLVEIEPTDSEYFIEYDIITPSGIDRLRLPLAKQIRECV